MNKEEAAKHFCSELAEHVPAFADWLKDRLREKAEREERERLERERLERERLERERQERERQERERQLRIHQQEMERQRLERERLARQQAESQQQQYQQQQLLQLQQQQQQQQQQPNQNHQRSMSDSNLHAPKSIADAAANGGGPASMPGTAQKQPAGGKNSIDAAEFRNGLRGSPDNELVVGRGEIVTVRVPKPSGKTTTRVLWQFSTVDYDVGFGLDFERVNEDGTTVLDPILPVMRVNAQNQVIEGRHETQHDGAWLLKFDNSYSYLRSKTVYYRILFQT